MYRSFSVNIPKISKKEFDLRAYGAIGDGRTSNTEAFRKAMEAAAEEGPEESSFRTGSASRAQWAAEASWRTFIWRTSL